MINVTIQTHFRVNEEIIFESGQPTARLAKALKSTDYVEFDSAQEALDWVNYPRLKSRA